MVEIDLSTIGLSGLLLMMDVRDFIKEKRERGWSDDYILEAIMAIGNAAEGSADRLLERLQTKRTEKEDDS